MTAIIDYDTGNLRSVAEALRRAGAEFTVTADPATLLRAERVILPGVGEASSAMARLREKGLDTLVPALTCPVLGICIGMQLLCRSSEEGDAACLGIFPTDVVRLPDRTADGPLKVPHWAGTPSTRCAGRSSRESTRRPTSTMSTPTRRGSATPRSPRPTTACGSARHSHATTSSARSSTPKRAGRRAAGFYATS